MLSYLMYGLEVNVVENKFFSFYFLSFMLIFEFDSIRIVCAFCVM